MHKPYYWLTKESKLFLDRGYLLENQTPEDRIKQIADTASSILVKTPKIFDFRKKFIEYMSKGYYSLSTPIWANFGLSRGLPISCFGSYIGDSVSDIMSTTAEVGMMSKIGGGTSAYFGDIRPRGSAITNNGVSDGSFAFTKIFEAVIDTINQGSCYTEGTEVLTDKGFKDFRDVDLNNDLLAQVDEYNNISFTKNYQLIKQPYKGIVYKYSGLKKDKLLDITVTPEHRMVIQKKKVLQKNKIKYVSWKESTDIVQARDLKLHRDNRFIIAGTATGDRQLSFVERLLIAHQADGRKSSSDRKWEFHLKKERKIARLLWILNNLSITPNLTETSEGSTLISFYCDITSKIHDFSWVNLSEISKHWAEDFIEEIGNWDGYIKDNCINYSSTNKSCVDIVQAVAVLANKRTTLFSLTNREGNRKDLHSVSISSVSHIGGDSLKTSKHDYDGYVYCASVPLGRLVVRNNGTSLICGNSRRGMFAGYIDIDHPDIEEWLNIHTEGNPIQLIYYGVCVGNDWLNEMKAGDQEKRKIWAKVLQRRSETGIPYIFFKDNANNHKPSVYADKPIYASNLCSEISLPSSLDESFVCCLSSLNLLHYDEWKDTDAVEVLTWFLDAVMEEFIQKGRKLPYLEKAVKFAQNHRAIGIGVLGWHSYLQSKMIPFESHKAFELNKEIFDLIRTKSYRASEQLAETFGECPLTLGTGRRNTTLLAVAPTKSSSFILGQVSPSIEPLKSNYFVRDLAKIKITYKNPYLEKILENRGHNEASTWQSILERGGSVQHLPFLTRLEKDVFKTFAEIDQESVIRQAADRQEYICQSQSLNLMIHPSTPVKEINRLYLLANELGIKSLYYQFSVNAAQEFNRKIVTCNSCES